MVVHTFDPRTEEAEQVVLCEFKASLVYKESSRPARAAQRKSYLKKMSTRKLNKLPSSASMTTETEQRCCKKGKVECPGERERPALSKRVTGPSGPASS